MILMGMNKVPSVSFIPKTLKISLSQRPQSEFLRKLPVKEGAPSPTAPSAQSHLLENPCQENLSPTRSSGGNLQENRCSDLEHKTGHVD